MLVAAVVVGALAIPLAGPAGAVPPVPAVAAAARWTPPALPTTPMSPADARRFDTAVSQALKGSAEQTPGAWVGVWSPTNGVRVKAYGQAARPGTPARDDDHNFMGSITKTVTATAVLQQVAKGTMKLSDTVRDLDPSLAAQFPAIADLTVDQLLGMRSGLPDYANEPAGVLRLIAADPKRQFTPRQLIEIGLAANAIQPAGTPGYSTTNYIILGELLAKVTGRTPAQVLNSVFAEAGMTQSALSAPGKKAPRPRSDGHIGPLSAEELAMFGAPAGLAGTDVAGWNLSWGRAGGGAYTTVEDLGRWGALGLGTALLPKKLGDRRIAVASQNPQGYGWGLFVEPGGWIAHTGQVIGWEASVKQNIRTGEVIVVMVNSTSGLGQITSAVDKALAP